MVLFEYVALLLLIIPSIADLQIWLLLALIVVRVAVIKDSLTALILSESALRTWGDIPVDSHVLAICVVLDPDLWSIRRDLHVVELDAKPARYLVVLPRVRNNSTIVDIRRI